MGGPKPDVLRNNQPPSYEDRVNMLIDNMDISAFEGANVGFKQAGCFITCHNSMRAMPLEPPREEVQNHPFFGQAGQNRTDIRKYLLISRTETDETGGWDEETKGFNAISEDELRDRLTEFPLIIDDPESAKEYDPEADFSEGDLLPQPILRQPEGSSADIQANGH
ncbi:MAG: hypothetical protein KGZ96_14020 [Clostridia bacterium]|jgi:hypothetical protein|nr:hypothetical protein [Clostridia bacterium]